MSTQLTSAPATTSALALPENGSTMISASALRAFYKDRGLKGKELTAEVNRRLAAFQPTADAIIGEARRRAYSVETVKCTKTGKIQITMAPPKAAAVEEKLSDAMSTIAKLEAKLAAMMSKSSDAAPALVGAPAHA